MSILKVDITIVSLFFVIYYAWVPKIEICLKYFLDKNSQKQPLWLPSSLMLYHKLKDIESTSKTGLLVYANVPKLGQAQALLVVYTIHIIWRNFTII